jgi:hypothetical protein
MPILDDGLYSVRGYIAPTVFKKSGIQINAGVNYYSDLLYAVSKYYFLTNQGGENIDPSGQVMFEPNTNPQTLGINVDFYTIANNAWQWSSYDYIKGLFTWPPMVFRFYSTAGDGPFYAIFDPAYMQISATAVDTVTADQLAALDGLYREKELLKYRYNSVAGFLNSLAQKILTPTEQQIYNEGNLRLQAMSNQMGGLQGIEFTYTSTGAVIGVIPVLLILGIVAILAVVASWTIQQVVDLQQKTKQINDSYELNEWVATKKEEIAQQVQAGKISQADADSINKNLDSAANSANIIATKAAEKSSSLLGSLGTILQWGVIGYVAFKTVPLLTEKLKKSHA